MCPASSTVATAPTLTDRINTEHRAVVEAFRRGLDHAHRAGQLLIEAKARLPHGQWLPWLKENVAFSERTAQGYIRIAKRWPELDSNTQSVADLGVADALKLLAAPRPETGQDDVLGWFLDNGLNEDHLHELRAIHEFYGDEPQAKLHSPQSPIESIEAAAGYLCVLRPEGKTVCYQPNEATVHELTEFFRRVQQHGGTIPEWERVAFWWACLAINGRFRAGDLARALDRWQERLCSAISYLWMYETPKTDEPPRLWWAHYHDAKHAGLIRHIREPWLYQRALAGLRGVDGWTYPSDVQQLLASHNAGEDLSEEDAAFVSYLLHEEQEECALA